MNYLKIYNQLIERAQNRQLQCYCEIHHIIPKCIGGSDDPINLISLTPEEHYLAHQLLIKIHPDNHLLLYAAQMMTVSNKNIKSVIRTQNKLYGWIKRKVSKSKSIQRTGYKHTEETKIKIGNAHRGRKNKPISEDHKERIREANRARVRKPWADDSRNHMSEIAKKRKPSKESNEKRRQKLLGRTFSEETKQKMRKPKSPEMRQKLSETRRRIFAEKKNKPLV